MNACTLQERVRLRQYRDGKYFSKAVSTGRLQLYVCRSGDEQHTEKEPLRFEYVDILSSRIRGLEDIQIMAEDDSIVSKTTKWKDIVSKFSRTFEGRVQMFKYMCRSTKCDDVDTIVALVAAGVSVHVRSNIRGRTLMHYAAANGSIRCLEALLHFGADPCACDFESRTPLHEACKYSRPDVVEILLTRWSAAASIMVRERVHEYVPLQEAAQYRSDRCLAMFARNARTAIEPLSLDVVRHALRLCISSWCHERQRMGSSIEKDDDEQKEEKTNVGEKFCEDDTRRVLFPSNHEDKLLFEKNELVVVRRSSRPYLRYGRIASIDDVEMKVFVECNKIKRLRVGSQQVGKLLLLNCEEAKNECMHTIHLSHEGHLKSSDCVLHASEHVDTKRDLLPTTNDDDNDLNDDERLSDYDTSRDGNSPRCAAILLELIGLMSFERSQSSGISSGMVRRRKVIV